MGTLVSNRGALFLNFYQLVIHRLFSCFLFFVSPPSVTTQ